MKQTKKMMRRISLSAQSTLKKIPRYFKYLIIIAAIIFDLAARCYCSQEWHYDTLEIRENDQNYNVTFIVPNGEMILYANSENCGIAAHRTVNGGRYFEHFHIFYTLPKEGIDDYGQIKKVTLENTTRWWDFNFYNSPPYVQVQAADPQYNCWGYSLGYYVWIQDPDYIYEDDYETTDVYAVNNKETTPGHIISITAVSGSPLQISQTMEKNRNSPVYRRNYVPSRSVNIGYEMKVRK